MNIMSSYKLGLLTTAACFAPDDGAGNGGGGGTGNNNGGGNQPFRLNNNSNNGNRDDKNKNNENNGDDGEEGETFLDKAASLWDKPKGKEGDGGGNQVDPREKAKKDDESLTEYVNSLDFGLKLDDGLLSEANQSGDYSKVQAALDGSQKTMMKTVLKSIAQITANSEARMMEKMKEIASSHGAASDSEKSLKTAIPALAGDTKKAKAMLPLAMVMKKRFINLGQSDGEANESVRMMIKEMNKEMNPDDDGDGTPPRNGPGNYNRGSQPRKGSSKEVDWEALMKGELN